ncbi:tripartite tricarboxylate transporter substrate binding protein [Verticiella sediminum]|uniref:Tripartite tricarboxylate transporter substrate binding protein n=1 Tax=Verticiella sediminum TaxID=1247510 RepID=A0A556AFB2_9BURK|nr:tripartite tricarboxylate transporter substrate binding protein [Verticiella sediminum]TSH91569.1 tripartite tricarboxylate transporter substrate binding protein [Verticiella sediminum]
MSKIRRRELLLAACAAAAMAVPGLAPAAQGAYPAHPIRLIVPFPPGGSADPLARVIGERLGQALGQQVLVENRPGGNTVIATELVARAPADGYTLLLTASSHVTNPMLVHTSYDPIDGFVPVATLSTSDMILVVNPSVQANSLQELLALAKAEPGALNYSSAGTGNPNHLAGELMDMMAGVSTTHVPYKGGAPAVTDLVGGHVQFSFGSPIIVLPFIRSGQLRPLAVTSPARMATLPDVPTMAESGLPGYEMRVWYGILAPAGTPADVVATLNREIDRIMATDESGQTLDAAGMERYTITPTEFTELMKRDTVKFRDIIQTANVTLN